MLLALTGLLVGVGPKDPLDSHEAHLIEVARAAIVSAVTGTSNRVEREVVPSKPVFVTIEVDGTVRGCRGDLRTRTRALDDEVALAAVGAAVDDPRYRPISAKELTHFLVTVTIVDRTEPITDLSCLSPEDGLVLTSGNRTGVVLPWEGKDPKTRLTWAYRKAKVSPGASVSLSCLIAKRFRG